MFDLIIINVFAPGKVASAVCQPAAFASWSGEKVFGEYCNERSGDFNYTCFGVKIATMQQGNPPPHGACLFCQCIIHTIPVNRFKKYIHEDIFVLQPACIRHSSRWLGTRGGMGHRVLARTGGSQGMWGNVG